MVTRVVSLLRGGEPGAARAVDPALELNTYAVAEDVELTLVLVDRGVELALAHAHHRPTVIRGAEVPLATPEQDVQALVASGVRVLVAEEDLAARGLGLADLLDGVEGVAEGELAALLAEGEVVLSCAS